jgi:predicted exporter
MPAHPVESTRQACVRDGSRLLATVRGAEATDVELEAAIVKAVLAGLGDVARVLAGQLEDRRRSSAENVVCLPVRRR